MAHFHKTATTNGLRQCTDPNCAAWTINGRDWAPSQASLMFVQPDYPTGADNERPLLVVLDMTNQPAEVAA